MLKTVLLFLLMFNSAYACALCGNKTSFVQASIQAYIADDSLQKVHVLWQFGASTSAGIASIYHMEKQMRADDLKKIYESFEQYQKPPFMTLLSINEEKISLKIENFAIFMDNGHLHVEFDIPLSYPLHNHDTAEIVFFDPAQTMVFLENLDDTRIINTTSYKVRKDNGIKVIKEVMATTNYIKLEVTQ